MKVIFAEADYEQIGAELEDYGVVIPASQLVSVVESFDDDLKGFIFQYGINDTEVSSSIADFISKKLIGKSWPCYGDSAQSKEDFEVLMKDACTIRGWEFNC
jgi:ABC-type branched-subunit amino acid transport system substrate-binding protein